MSCDYCKEREEVPGHCRHYMDLMPNQCGRCADERMFISLHDEIEKWQDASGLERGGDPSGVTPDDLAADIRARHSRALAWKKSATVWRALALMADRLLKGERMQTIEECAMVADVEAGKLHAQSLDPTVTPRDQFSYEQQDASARLIADEIRRIK